MKTLLLIISILIALLFGYNMGYNKNKDLLKYRPLEDVLQTMSRRTYNSNEYNCLNYSKDSQALLRQNGIEGSILIGRAPNEPYKHAFIGIWIEPQTGKFITPDKYLNTHIYGQNLSTKESN